MIIIGDNFIDFKNLIHVYFYGIGHITIGGSICMELLTKSGWRPTNDIEVNLYNKFWYVKLGCFSGILRVPV